MWSSITSLCLVSMIIGCYGIPITNNTEVNDAANVLTSALNTFVNAKGNELMEVVSENVGEIQEEIEGHSEHLQLLESEIQTMAETGSLLGCRGVLHHGYCYFLINQRYSVHSAELSCERSEGELATFADQTCIDAVHDYIIHTDQITDKSTVFVWTDMTTNDDSSILDTDDNWLPGFPVNSSAENVMWQIMSDDFFLYHDGFLNAPSEATAYPLCRKYVIQDPDQECADGWSGDNCELDLDECELGTHTCNENADCLNNNGSFTCTCSAGWTGDGYHCEDIHECDLGEHTCDDNAVCENNNGSYTCVCNTGYSGDGTTCEDEDECALGTDTCDENASCQNTVGSYTCTCNSGWSGDGFTCDNGCIGKTYNGKCYVILTDQMRDYTQSYYACQAAPNQHMAYINDWPIQNVVMGYSREVMDSDNFYLWVGGIYNIASYPTKSVQWGDGQWTTIPDNHWYPGYPSQTSTYTALLIQVNSNPSSSSQGMFNYYPEYSSGAYALCEYDL